ncbi:MAG: hypothetical protein VKJ46_01590 [Leptolyngbyaceae bacterium]|nr:hypothetical protein [Leptolyngbyaceae bacterium]
MTRQFKQRLGCVSIAVVVMLGVIFGSFYPLQAEDGLPSPQTHPLPKTLAQWRDPKNQEDYFDQIQPTEVGYLIWSRFPVKVYVEQGDPTVVSGSSTPPRQHKQFQAWTEAVLQAVREWNSYLPLTVVEQPDLADITIWRSVPPIQRSRGNPPPRIRSAETRYTLYKQTVGNSGEKALTILSHRCTILLKPSQTIPYIQAAARHELGHALGIWGHSPQPTDALYFAQVRNPPPISSRDLNTLKRVYEQPTRLGWPLPLEKTEGGDRPLSS